MAGRPQHIVVVGASLAGLRAAQACRSAGHDGSLTIIGAEPHYPYNRPPLSKQLLASEAAASIAELDLGHSDLDANWELGKQATAVNPRSHTVTIGERTIGYDRLIIATGSSPRRWPDGQLMLDGVMTLRTLDDSLTLSHRLRAATRLLVVGAGFIGCEVAATARLLGIDVTMIDLAAHPMAPLGAELGSWCASLHRDRGVDLRMQTGVARWLGDHTLDGVVLTDGTTLDCDLALLALGSTPNGDWLAGSGLETRDCSLICDETLTSTTDPDILGAGDVVSIPHPLADNGLLRVEHWSNAVEQGTLAGQNVLQDPDQRQHHHGVPSFWSDQYGLRIQSIGLPARAQTMRFTEGSPTEPSFITAGYRDDKLICAIGVNAGARLRPYRRELAAVLPRGEAAAAN